MSLANEQPRSVLRVLRSESNIRGRLLIQLWTSSLVDRDIFRDQGNLSTRLFAHGWVAVVLMCFTPNSCENSQNGRGLELRSTICCNDLRNSEVHYPVCQDGLRDCCSRGVSLIGTATGHLEKWSTAVSWHIGSGSTRSMCMWGKSCIRCWEYPDQELGMPVDLASLAFHAGGDPVSDI